MESRHLGGGEVITRVVVKKGPLRNFFYVEEATGLYFLKTIYEKETGDQTTRDPITGNDRQSPFAACSLPEFFAGIKSPRKISQNITALGLCPQLLHCHSDHLVVHCRPTSGLVVG